MLATPMRRAAGSGCFVGWCMGGLAQRSSGRAARCSWCRWVAPAEAPEPGEHLVQHDGDAALSARLHHEQLPQRVQHAHAAGALRVGNNREIEASQRPLA